MDDCSPHYDEILELVGYRRNRLKTLAVWIAMALSGFTLAFLFYWRRDYWVALTHTKVNVSQAEVILLRSASFGTDISDVYVQSLLTNRTHLYKYLEDDHASETSPLFSVKDHNSVKFFFYRNLKYIWYSDKNIFSPIRYCITIVAFCQILSPFYIFQIFSVMLWMSSEYYFYASVILILSATSVILSTLSCRKNERQLRDKVKMAETVFVLRGVESKPIEIPSVNLVPGDVVCIPPFGCELVADMLLISGSCTVNEANLNGESVPQMKSAITELATPTTDEDRKIDIRRLARHVLFSGTRVLQARESFEGSLVKAVVLRTGFLTVKGDLVRAILHPKPLDVDFNIDSFRFLSIMAVIAIAGFIYTCIVLQHYNLGVGAMIRKSLDIFTIVVPPALPSVMTTGLYLAQLRLRKLNIFCINPSAINIAGTLNTIVFDKTGTLTEEYMSVKGVWKGGPCLESHALSRVDQIANQPGPLSAVLAACHSLTVDPSTCEIVGDPLDRIIFTSTNWALQERDLEKVGTRFTSPIQAVICNSRIDSSSPWQQLGILRHFPFSSTAQRQSVVVETVGKKGEIAVLTKGAPEAIAKHCKPHTLPQDFDEKLAYFSKQVRLITSAFIHLLLDKLANLDFHEYSRFQGHRVLALAWKSISSAMLNDNSDEKVSAWTTVYQFQRRDYFECDLHFLGLVVLDNPVKSESEPTIRELLNANFRVIMATGVPAGYTSSICKFINSVNLHF
ncbi:unnamed protein product [Hydatigera taeniaeformis]|uniref:Cation-transporting ATPase n=1 Tax=Hydatigena taeniaeformis TaxID=6205 RepID=A0A0R3X8P0_HYDTA|nr:unnamed protein product [Hydatigera taeniaeformis]